MLGGDAGCVRVVEETVSERIILLGGIDFCPAQTEKEGASMSHSAYFGASLLGVLKNSLPIRWIVLEDGYFLTYNSRFLSKNACSASSSRLTMGQSMPSGMGGGEPRLRGGPRPKPRRAEEPGRPPKSPMPLKSRVGGRTKTN